MKEGKKTIFCLLLSLSIFLVIICCAPIVYSPHAQNEMITPYNLIGERHEISGAFAYNNWTIHRGSDTVYIRTYPSASFSFFHNAYYARGNFGGIGGLELICFPSQWLVDDASGSIFYFKPFVGFQYSGSIITSRLNFSPINFAFGYGNGELGLGGGLAKLTFYQLTILLHNRLPSKHICWGGVRNSPGALGIIGGYEYSFNSKNFIRAEYSFLKPPPFSIFFNKEDLESIVGSVYYLTVGFFRRLK